MFVGGKMKSCDEEIYECANQNGTVLRTYFVVRHLDDVFTYCTVDTRRFNLKPEKRIDSSDV